MSRMRRYLNFFCACLANGIARVLLLDVRTYECAIIVSSVLLSTIVRSHLMTFFNIRRFDDVGSNSSHQPSTKTCAIHGNKYR